MDQYSGQISSGQIDAQQMYTMIRKQVAKKLQFQLNGEDQVNWLAHQIHDRIYNDDLIDYASESKALQALKKTLAETLHIEDALDDVIRNKIKSLQREVPEGSRDWEILYRKYMEEELQKRV